MPTRNVLATLCFYGTAGFAGALQDTVMSNLLLALEGDYVWIGLCEGLQGLAQLLVAIPMGKYADKHSSRQASLLRKVVVVGFLTNIFLALISLDLVLNDFTNWSTWTHFLLFGAGLVGNGLFVGLYDPPLEALWSNALENGEERTRANSLRSSVSQIASLAGPVTSLMFFANDDTWSTLKMSTVVLIGAFLSCVSLIFFGFFQPTHGALQHRLLDIPPEKENSGPETLPTKIAWIPRVCLASNILFALGSGMTVKFWGLFFQREINYTPVELNLLLICNAIALCLLLQMSQLLRGAKNRVGRLRLALVQLVIGMIMQSLVAFWPEIWNRQKYVVGLFVLLRYAFLNVGTPTIAAILTDHLDENQRALWAALDSVTTAGWCGSAMLGGWLADTYGFGPAFAATLVLHVAGTLCLLPVLKHEV